MEPLSQKEIAGLQTLIQNLDVVSDYLGRSAEYSLAGVVMGSSQTLAMLAARFAPQPAPADPAD